MALSRAYVGIGPPNVLTQNISDPSGTLDLTTVTAVNLLVIRADGSTVTWATSITSSSKSAISISHTFASGDCTVIGSYQITPQLVFSSGTTNCFTKTLNVCQATIIS